LHGNKQYAGVVGVIASGMATVDGGLYFSLLVYLEMMNADAVYCDPLDDSFKACNYMLHWPDFFQLSCYGVFCQCGKFPGEMESRPLYVQRLITLIRIIDNIIDM
jgi:hypothetical protein